VKNFYIFVHSDLDLRPLRLKLDWIGLWSVLVPANTV